MKEASDGYDALTDEQKNAINAGSGILFFAAKAGRLDILQKFTDPAEGFNYDPTLPNEAGATPLEFAHSTGGEVKAWADAFGALLGR